MDLLDRPGRTGEDLGLSAPRWARCCRSKGPRLLLLPTMCRAAKLTSARYQRTFSGRPWSVWGSTRAVCCPRVRPGCGKKVRRTATRQQAPARSTRTRHRRFGEVTSRTRHTAAYDPAENWLLKQRGAMCGSRQGRIGLGATEACRAVRVGMPGMTDRWLRRQVGWSCCRCRGGGCLARGASEARRPPSTSWRTTSSRHGQRTGGPLLRRPSVPARPPPHQAPEPCRGARQVLGGRGRS